ncbi:hypothetical protein K4L44_10670 [Halosquirtibacter laminarini]|uniref:Uncharacterized protein n=1 Tax=Halosquirtibacter laminarini TaxID=3374600 RepID=A0AC61NLG8_9BACT|nr:hypothetical protein K4L44_10670 [Prolixibacteraceae bacterium]
MNRILHKLLLLLMVSCSTTFSIFAQSPEAINYQAVIRNGKGELHVNKEVGMKVSILKSSVEGATIYTETHNIISNKNGLVSIQIGTGSTSDPFSNIDWAEGVFFIKVETDITGGSDYTLVGVSQLLSVPYALHAKTAESISGTLNESDPLFSDWDKSDGIVIQASQIIDQENIAVKEKDGDVTNEIQDLSLEGDILKITRNGTATSIDLSKYLDNENTQLTTEEVKKYCSSCRISEGSRSTG